jgi:hypothetical protein
VNSVSYFKYDIVIFLTSPEVSRTTKFQSLNWFIEARPTMLEDSSLQSHLISQHSLAAHFGTALLLAMQMGHLIH